MQCQSSPQGIRLTLPCGPDAPGLARAALRAVLGERQIGGDAMLVASELVTNAVTHSGCGQEQVITLDARISGGCLRISVHDPGRTGKAPRVRDAPAVGCDSSSDSPVGGASDRPDGCLVWAELALQAA
jgi:anti-sigma regulatory factor (Ser/Thr protein kinase)